MCVQRFDDSLNSAIRITYRISLRSSSMPEPRDPLLKVLTIDWYAQTTQRWRVEEVLPAGLPAKAIDLVVHHRMVSCGGPSRNPQRSVMILPQVHLRKPCYDFYFL